MGNNEYIKTLVRQDFTTKTTVPVNDADYTIVASFRVPVKNVYWVGNGAINLGVDDRGTMTLALKDASSNTIGGSFRVEYADSNKLNCTFLREDLSTDAASGVKVGKGGKTGFGGQLPYVTEYQYILVKFIMTYVDGEQSDTATMANSTITMPVTIRALN